MIGLVPVENLFVGFVFVETVLDVVLFCHQLVELLEEGSRVEGDLISVSFQIRVMLWNLLEVSNKCPK